MSEQKKSAVETKSQGSQELNEQELDGVAGGMMSVRFPYTWGHTVYDVTIGVSSTWPYLSASAQGMASR